MTEAINNKINDSFIITNNFNSNDDNLINDDNLSNIESLNGLTSKEYLGKCNMNEEKDHDDGVITTEEFLYQVYNDVQEIKQQNQIFSERGKSVDNFIEKLNQLSERCDSLEQTCIELEEKNVRISHELLLEQAEKQEMIKKVISLNSVVNSLAQDALEQEKLKYSEKVVEDNSENIIDKTNISNCEAKLEIAIKQIETLEKLYETTVAKEKDVSGRLSDLESELQSFVRRHSLIIENFCPREDSSAINMFILFVKNILKVQIDEADIEGLHIISKTQPSSAAVSPRNTPRPILVTFSCYGTKARIYREWLAYRTSNEDGKLSMQTSQGLSIREYLSEANEAIYEEAMELKKQKKVADVWTFKSKTFIKDFNGEIKDFVGKNNLKNEKSASSCTLM